VIGSERMTAYINSLDQGYPAYLEQIERAAQEASIPIIRKEVQSFLRTVLSIEQPRRILEVGTAVGFSALLMSEYAPEDCRITTIENYEKRIPLARKNFALADKEVR